MSSPSLEAQPSTRRGSAVERDAARRQRLLYVGLDVFGTEGYVASAIESICARAGVGTHSFYSEFETKEDLLIAVYDGIVERLATRVATTLARQVTDLDNHIRAGIEVTVEDVGADSRAARVRLLEVVGVSERLEAHRRAVHELFAEVIRQDSARLATLGWIQGGLSSIQSLALVGATDEIFVDWTLEPQRYTQEQLVDELTAIHLAVLRSGSAASAAPTTDG